MNLKENWSRSKEVLGAYFRQGLRELGNAFYSGGTAASHPEYGMISTKPPSMVVEGLRGEQTPQAARDDVGPSQLQQHMEQIPEPEQAAPEVGMDIERE
jgi:hypothetical protein